MSDGASVDDEFLVVDEQDADWCAVTNTMALIGKKWQPVIIHRLLAHETLHFNELADEIPGITNKTLSRNLEDLGEKGFVDRTIVNEKPVRVAYSLTERGETLEPVIRSLAQWGKEHLAPSDEYRNTTG